VLRLWVQRWRSQVGDDFVENVTDIVLVCKLQMYWASWLPAERRERLYVGAPQRRVDESEGFRVTQRRHWPP